MPKHRSFTVKYKLDAIEWHKDNGASITKTAKEFAVDRKRIREWLGMEEDLRDNSHGKDVKKRRLHAGNDAISQELKAGVLEYLLEERAKGYPVTNANLKEKALSLGKDIEDVKLNNFKASEGWLKRWKRRNRVSILRGTSEAQKIPADYGDQIKQFIESIRAKRQENNYTEYNIINMDQTMCRFDMAPSKTNNLMNERSVRICTPGGPSVGLL